MIRAIQFLDKADHRDKGIPGSFFLEPAGPDGVTAMWFYCPSGNGQLCCIRVGIGAKPPESPSWGFHGSVLAPTLEPSVRQHKSGWHGWLRDGYWEEAG